VDFPLFLFYDRIVSCERLIQISNKIKPKSRRAVTMELNFQAARDGGWAVKMAESVMKRDPQVPDRWSYEDGVIYKGLEEVYNNTKDDRYWKYIQDNLELFVDENGNIRKYRKEDYNIDYVNNGKALLYIYQKTGEEKFKKAADDIRDQLRTHPRTSEGGLWHKQIYPFQMWLDGIYMGSPFYAEYAKLFNEPDAFDDVAKQVLLIEKHLKDPQTGLYYHGWDEKREQQWADPKTGLSPEFWGRAMGWYIMAIVDILDYMPVNHSKRQDMIRILEDMIQALEAVQDPSSGVWYQVLDKGGQEGNYLEASASCMIVYSIAKAVRLGYIDAAYNRIVQKGYAGIISEFIEVDGDGMVNLLHNCAMAGLGRYYPEQPYRDGTYEYYISEPVVPNDPKGVGAFLLAAAEAER
jgi:unsaturated rhamnogalacturonyl hydrolase